ncbi:MAG: hypothetical protein IJZ03_01685 [Clostridia bacterium]|nr:hypothetical protein [Clostridia bacterium]
MISPAFKHPCRCKAASALSFLIALSLLIGMLLTSCGSPENKTDGKQGDEESLAVTKENAGKILVDSLKALINSPSFSGKAVMTYKESSRSVSQPMVFSVEKKSDGEYKMLVKDIYNEKFPDEYYGYYYDGKQAYCYGEWYGFSYAFSDEAFTPYLIIRRILTGAGIDSFEHTASTFAKLCDISEKNGNYILNVKTSSYLEIMKILESDAVFDDRINSEISGDYEKYDSVLTFTVNKSGVLVGMYLSSDYDDTDMGERGSQTFDVSFTDIGKKVSVTAPEWISDVGYDEKSSFTQILDGVAYEYSYDDNALCFMGASYAENYGYPALNGKVKAYTVLDDILGIEVKYILSEGDIIIKNLVVPENASFPESDEYVYSLENTRLYFKGEYDGFVPSVINHYLEGEWSYKDGIPTPNVSDADSIEGEDLSSNFVGLWESTVDLTERVEMSLNDEGSSLFDFDGLTLTVRMLFGSDNTYKVTISENSSKIFADNFKKGFSEALPKYYAKLASEMGYESLDDLLAEMDLTLKELVNDAVAEFDVEGLIDDMFHHKGGAFLAKGGRLYTSTDADDDINKRYYEEYVMSEDNKTFSLISASEALFDPADDSKDLLYPIEFVKIES